MPDTEDRTETTVGRRGRCFTLLPTPLPGDSLTGLSRRRRARRRGASSRSRLDARRSSPTRRGGGPTTPRMACCRRRRALPRAGDIDRDALADASACTCTTPSAGTAPAPCVILRQIREGTPGRSPRPPRSTAKARAATARAMRVAPLGACFADSPRAPPRQAGRPPRSLMPTPRASPAGGGGGGRPFAARARLGRPTDPRPPELLAAVARTHPRRAGAAVAAGLTAAGAARRAARDAVRRAGQRRPGGDRAGHRSVRALGGRQHLDDYPQRSRRVCRPAATWTPPRRSPVASWPRTPGSPRRAGCPPPGSRPANRCPSG